jgi:DNA-binding Lrp family transcriptional regulator
MNREVIKILQEDLPVVETPFKLLAEKIGLSEPELIAGVKMLEAEGIIRKYGAILKHQEAGFAANAMVVFNVPDDKVDEIGEKIAAFNEVSHCYERPRFPGFAYNLYAMTHGKTRQELESSVGRIAQVIAVNDYQLLWSKKEYKKASPKYF